MIRLVFFFAIALGIIIYIRYLFDKKQKLEAAEKCMNKIIVDNDFDPLYDGEKIKENCMKVKKNIDEKIWDKILEEKVD